MEMVLTSSNQSGRTSYLCDVVPRSWGSRVFWDMPCKDHQYKKFQRENNNVEERDFIDRPWSKRISGKRGKENICRTKTHGKKYYRIVLLYANIRVYVLEEELWKVKEWSSTYFEPWKPHNRCLELESITLDRGLPNVQDIYKARQDS